MAPLFVLIGTGTSVGKTYVAERLLRAFACDGHRVLGYKPVESGVSESSDTDIARLGRASSFHVQPPLHSDTFAAPVSPHVAARLEGRAIDVDAISREILRARSSAATIVLLELPGGAFSPFTETVCCAQFARSVPGAQTLLVAVNRLGVLHDVGSTARAASALGLPLRGVVLNEPSERDASSGTNAAELRTVTRLPLLAEIPRLPAEAPVLPGDPALALARILSPAHR